MFKNSSERKHIAYVNILDHKNSKNPAQDNTLWRMLSDTILNDSFKTYLRK